MPPTPRTVGLLPVTHLERLSRWLVLALLVLLVAFSFGPALVGHGMLLDSAWLHRFWPYSAAGPIPEGTIWCRGDTYDFYLPGVANTVQAAWHGDWQTWAPYEVGGSPLASLPNHAVLTPVSWPYWVMPLWLAPGFEKLTELVLVVVGMTAFLGRLGVRRSVGMLAGLVFFTCGFMMMWTNWPHTKVGAFIPALFWALDRAVTRRRPRDIALVGLVVASMLLGGFPAVTLFALTLGAAYVVVRGLSLRRPGRVAGAWACAGAGVGLGAALSALQLLPFARNIGGVLEQRHPGGAQPLSLLMTAVSPDAYGTCAGGFWAGESNPVESISFLGIGAVVLALCAVTVRRPSGLPRVPVFWAVALVVIVGLVWVGGEPLALLQRLPGYDSNSIARANSVFGFVGAVLAGLGLERLLQRATADDRPERGWRPALPVGIALTLVVAAVSVPVVVEARRTAVAHRDLAHFSAAARLPLVLLVIAVLAVAATLLLRGRLRLVGPLALAVTVGAQSIVFAHGMLHVGDRADFYPETPAHRFLEQHLGEDRYGGADNWGYPAVSDWYHLRTPTGHEFTDSAWKEILNAAAPGTVVGPTFSRFPADVADAGHNPALDQLAVRYWATGPNQVAGVTGRAPAAGDRPVSLAPDATSTCEVPGDAPLRGITVQAAAAKGPTTSGRPAQLHVRVTRGGATAEGVRTVQGKVRAGASLAVAVAGEDLPPGRATVEVWFTGYRNAVQLVSDEAGTGPACAAIRPGRDDRLKLVFSDAGSIVYERLDSLPRIRWAGRSEVVADRAQRLARVTAGVPRDTVLLDSGATPAATGSTASVDVRTDEPETIAADVTSASGDGYLVVADSIARPGWTATVDGRSAPVVRGNHAFAAVPVPAGSHRVELHYTAPGLKAGLVVSAVAGIVALVLLALPFPRRRRRREAAAEAPSP